MVKTSISIFYVCLVGLVVGGCERLVTYNEPVLSPETQAVLQDIPQNSHQVLSLAGGALLGVGWAALLEGIEKATNKAIWEHFEYMVGNSTGSILTVGLTVPGDNGKPKYTASQTKQFYFDIASILYPKSLGGNTVVESGRGNNCFIVTDFTAGERIPCASDGKILGQFLNGIFGEATLGQLLTKVGIAISVNNNDQILPVMLSTIDSSPYAVWSKGYPAWQAAYISSLNTHFFSPVKTQLPLNVDQGFDPNTTRYFPPGPQREFEIIDGAYSGLDLPFQWLLLTDTKELSLWENEDVVIYAVSSDSENSISASQYVTYKDGNRVARRLVSRGPPTASSVKTPGTITLVNIRLRDSGQRGNDGSLASLDSLAVNATKLAESNAFKAVLATLKK